MTQRGIIYEIDGGVRSVWDIIEWPEDRVDLNKRRLRREVKNRGTGDYELLIEQVDGPERGKKLYEGAISAD